MKNYLKGYSFIILATLIWGTSALWIRQLEITAFQTSFLRTFIASLMISFLLYKKIRFKKIKRDYKYILLAGVGTCFTFVFYFLAVETTTVGNALLSIYTAPILVGLLAPVLIREKLDKFTLIALPIGFIGLYLVLPGAFSLQNKDFLGILYGLGCALSIALFAVYSKYLTKRHKNIEILFYQLVISAAILLPIYIIKPVASMSGNTLFFLIILIFFSTLAAYFFFIKGIRYVKVQHGEFLAYFEVLFAILFGAIFLNEIPPLETIFGGILIIVGGIIVISSKK